MAVAVQVGRGGQSDLLSPSNVIPLALGAAAAIALARAGGTERQMVGRRTCSSALPRYVLRYLPHCSRWAAPQRSPRRRRPASPQSAIRSELHPAADPPSPCSSSSRPPPPPLTSRHR